jgi:hypothetical protein
MMQVDSRESNHGESRPDVMKCFDRLNFETSCDFHYSTRLKRLCSHLRPLNRVTQLASY